MKSRIFLFLLDCYIVYGLTHLIQAVGYEKAFGYPTLMSCLPFAFLLTLPLHILIFSIHSKNKVAVSYRMLIAIYGLIHLSPIFNVLLRINEIERDISFAKYLLSIFILVIPYFLIAFILQHEIAYIYRKCKRKK